MGDWVVAQQLALTCSKYLIISSGCVILYSTHIPDFFYVCVAYVYTTVRLYLPVCVREGGREGRHSALAGRKKNAIPFSLASFFFI